MRNLATILLFTFSIFIVEIADATIYYVSTAGNDSNPGTNSQPWATLSHAESAVLREIL